MDELRGASAMVWYAVAVGMVAVAVALAARLDDPLYSPILYAVDAVALGHIAHGALTRRGGPAA